MRHSSWTLFLIPLALPLVLFLFPGAKRTADRHGPAVEESVELYEEGLLPTRDIVVVSGGSGDGLHGESSGALYR